MDKEKMNIFKEIFKEMKSEEIVGVLAVCVFLPLTLDFGITIFFTMLSILFSALIFRDLKHEKKRKKRNILH